MLLPRLTLLAAVLAALPAAAQVRPADAPVLPARLTPAGQAAAPLARPGAALAACAPATTVGQPAVAMATFNTAVGNATPPDGTPQELGQSLAAPCDGLLDRFSFVGQTTVAEQSISGTIRVFAGTGTAGALLSETFFGYSLPAVGAYFFDVRLDPVAVAQGQIVSAFVDLDSPTDIEGDPTDDLFYQQYVTPGTYAGGAMLISTSGSAAGAGTLAAFDLFFTATFAPATTVQTPAVTDGPGWRLLSAPVSGVTVADLATQNLVQGVDGGGPASLYPRQYPDAQTNLFVLYVPGAYAPPSSTANVLEPGAGFFWYWYDRAITPDPASFGGGTSTSRDLAGFSLTATGVANTASVARQLLASGANASVLLGNPFAAPLALSGLSLAPGSGTLSTVFQAFDPATGSYVPLTPADVVAPWQGFFGEVLDADFPVLVTDIGATRPAPTVPFYGRPAAEGALAFSLDGETDAGETHDRAATVRFLPDALAGRDRHDGAKLTPPGDAFALVAPVAAGERLAVSSLPDAPADVTLAFTATHAGTFTLAWDGTLGRPAVLEDMVTGDRVDLAAAPRYTFTSTATDWTERFRLVVGGRATAGEAAPEALRVGAFAPNPAAGASRLTFTSDAAQSVRATVIDALGRTVRVLFDGAVAAGAETTLTVSGLAPGTYAVRVAGATFAEARRLVVVR